MKHIQYFFFLFLLVFPQIIISQCNEETIKYDNGTYIGCVNYEGEKNGKGILTLNLDTQTQIQDGIFENDNFIKGKLIVRFLSGDTNTANYLNYQTDLIENELYEWDNGDKMSTYYSSDGKKVKEVSTYGPGESEGLIIEKIFNSNGTKTIRNIDNNRIPDDIIGEPEFSDVKLIERDNQYRINVGFPKINGDVMNVPIQFDSGATSFFIGNRLYKDLLANCEIEDMNVESMSGGVGSEFKTKYIKIKSIQIGDYVVKNVIAVVPLREDINDLLIGIGFLKKFKEVLWSLNSNLMRFYK